MGVVLFYVFSPVCCPTAVMDVNFGKLHDLGVEVGGTNVGIYVIQYVL